MREEEDKLVEDMDNYNASKEVNDPTSLIQKENNNETIENESETRGNGYNEEINRSQDEENFDIEIPNLENEEYIEDENRSEVDAANVLDENSGVFCSSCGEKVSEVQIFCPKCGKKIIEDTTEKKKKKNLIVGVIGLILIIAFSVIFIKEKKQIEEEKRQQAIVEMQQEEREQYIVDFKSFTYKVVEAGANLEEITSTIHTYWHENIFENKHGSDIDAAISNAMSDQSDKINKANSLDDEILDLFTKLKEVPEGSEDFEKYVNDIGALYNAYSDYYNFAVNPSGNYTQYSPSNSDKSSTLLTKYKTVESILKFDSNLNFLSE